jgi:flagella basal body P-ring formation protein FlgA
MISRGDRVKVKVVGTGILLTVVGQAQEAGAKGQTIKVINTDSHKEFLGVVTDAKEVEVRL